MNNNTRRYRTQLANNLLCGNSKKKILLKKFDAALETYLDDHPFPSTQELNNAFGPPDIMARIIMEELDESERSRYSNQSQLVKIIAGIVLSLLLLFSAYILFIKEFSDIQIVETGTEEGSYIITEGD